MVGIDAIEMSSYIHSYSPLCEIVQKEKDENFIVKMYKKALCDVDLRINYSFPMIFHLLSTKLSHVYKIFNKYFLESFSKYCIQVLKVRQSLTKIKCDWRDMHVPMRWWHLTKIDKHQTKAKQMNSQNATRFFTQQIFSTETFNGEML